MSRPTARHLGVVRRSGMRVRHGGRILGEVLRHGPSRGLGWVIPVLILLALPALAFVTTQAVVPVVVYTLV